MVFLNFIDYHKFYIFEFYHNPSFALLQGMYELAMIAWVITTFQHLFSINLIILGYATLH